MCLSCICGLAEVFFPPARNAHRIINCVSETVFYSAIGCMLAQVNADIDLRRNERDYNSVPGEDRAIPIAQTYQSYIG